MIIYDHLCIFLLFNLTELADQTLIVSLFCSILSLWLDISFAETIHNDSKETFQFVCFARVLDIYNFLGWEIRLR